MFINILANIGMLLVNIYFLMKFTKSDFYRHLSVRKQIILITILEVIFGLLLMEFSVLISNVRFDLRFIFFPLLMKYVGTKVTIPTILILAGFRFVYGDVLTSAIYLLSVIILISVYPLIYKQSKKYFGDLGQLLILMFTYLIILSPLVLSNLSNFRVAIYVYAVLLIIGIPLLVLIKNLIKDVMSLSDQVYRDGLTNLYNSRSFYEDLALFNASKDKFACLVVDIDHFKKINDQHGHLSGDELLKKVAQILQQFEAHNLKFYRFGGEEFITLIQNPLESELVDISHKIHQAINQIEHISDSRERIIVTVSIGIAEQENNEELLKTFSRADQALYQAKQNGRNQTVLSIDKELLVLNEVDLKSEYIGVKL